MTQKIPQNKTKDANLLCQLLKNNPKQEERIRKAMIDVTCGYLGESSTTFARLRQPSTKLDERQQVVVKKVAKKLKLKI